MATIYFTRNGGMIGHTVKRFYTSNVPASDVKELTDNMNALRSVFDHADGIEYHYIDEDMTEEEFRGHRMHFMSAEEIAKDDEEKALIDHLDDTADEYAQAVYDVANEPDMFASSDCSDFDTIPGMIDCDTCNNDCDTCNHYFDCDASDNAKE